MLPRHHRLHRSGDFRTVVRSGARSGGRYVVVHLRAHDRYSAPAGGLPTAAQKDHLDPTRVGLVVGRAVGGSVTRSLVSRRLRARFGDRLRSGAPDSLPAGWDIVVRALPGAAGASWPQLIQDTDRCVDRALAKAAGRLTVGHSPRTDPGSGA